MQISLHGLQQSHGLPNEFPYDAVSPLSGQKETFNSIDDVYDVLEKCYNECLERGMTNMGKALYESSLFVVNDNMLVDVKIQDQIKAYKYCKESNTPPFPSLQETPINTIDNFLIIDREIKNFKLEVSNGSK